MSLPPVNTPIYETKALQVRYDSTSSKLYATSLTNSSFVLSNYIRFQTSSTVVTPSVNLYFGFNTWASLFGYETETPTGDCCGPIIALLVCNKGVAGIRQWAWSVTYDFGTSFNTYYTQNSLASACEFIYKSMVLGGIPILWAQTSLDYSILYVPASCFLSMYNLETWDYTLNLCSPTVFEDDFGCFPSTGYTFGFRFLAEYSTWKEAQTAAPALLDNFSNDGTGYWAPAYIDMLCYCDESQTNNGGGVADPTDPVKPDPDCQCNGFHTIPRSSFTLQSISPVGWQTGTSTCVDCSDTLFSFTYSGTSYYACGANQPTLPNPLYSLSDTWVVGGHTCSISGSDLVPGSIVSLPVTDSTGAVCKNMRVRVPTYRISVSRENCTTCNCSECTSRFAERVTASDWKCMDDKWVIDKWVTCGWTGPTLSQCHYYTKQGWDSNTEATIYVDQRDLYTTAGGSGITSCDYQTLMTPNYSCDSCDEAEAVFEARVKNQAWDVYANGSSFNGWISYNGTSPKCSDINCDGALSYYSIPDLGGSMMMVNCSDAKEPAYTYKLTNREYSYYIGIGSDRKLVTYRFSTASDVAAGQSVTVYASYSIDGSAFRDCTSFTTTAPSYSISKKDCYKRCIRQFETQYDCSEASWADWVIDTTVCGDEDSYSLSSELSTSDNCKKLYIKKGSKRCVDFVDLDVSCTGITYPSKPSQTPMGCCAGWYFYRYDVYCSSGCSSNSIGTNGNNTTHDTLFRVAYVSNPSIFFNVCESELTWFNYRVPLSGPYDNQADLLTAIGWVYPVTIRKTQSGYSGTTCDTLLSVDTYYSYNQGAASLFLPYTTPCGQNCDFDLSYKMTFDIL